MDLPATCRVRGAKENVEDHAGMFATSLWWHVPLPPHSPDQNSGPASHPTPDPPTCKEAGNVVGEPDVGKPLAISETCSNLAPPCPLV